MVVLSSWFMRIRPLPSLGCVAWLVPALTWAALARADAADPAGPLTPSASATKATSGSEAPASDRSPVATIPFRSQRGRVLLPATINDSGPLTFLLDTGYSITTVHPDLPDALRLRRVGRVAIDGIAGEEEAPTYAGAEFHLGPVTYAPRRVAAVPSEGQSQRRRRRDGIIGAGLFRRFVVQLDFPAGCVRLYEPDRYRAAEAAGAVPLRLRRDIPSVTATIRMPDGRVATGSFEVDTGCDDGVCFAPTFVAAEHLADSLARDDAGVKRGVGGEARVRSGRVAAVRLGRNEALNVTASFFEDNSPAGDGMAGHIGMHALRQFIVTIDYSRQQLILEPLRRP